MKKFFIKTFGCQQNKRDSEIIASYYKNLGFKETKKIEEADVIVINTCSVRQSAEDRVYGLVKNLGLRVKNKKRKPKIILTGCMVGLYGKNILSQRMPIVDEFKKTDEWQNYHKPSPSGLVNIMSGCNNFCSYCVVPYARGREKSRPIEEILEEVEDLIKGGIKEITLIGQNVNSYGKDFENSKFKNQKSKTQIKSQKYKTPFANLLYILHQNPDLKKISFLTSNPWDLNDEIIEVMSLPKIDRYLHLPVQSGDDEILRRMNRPYTAQQYLSLVKKIRRKIPDIKIGTDIIVGFPGETDKAFKNTVKLCQKAGFFKAYIAMYSPRPKTAAYKLKDDVPYKIKKERWCILENLINKKQ